MILYGLPFYDPASTIKFAIAVIDKHLEKVLHWVIASVDWRRECFLRWRASHGQLRIPLILPVGAAGTEDASLLHFMLGLYEALWHGTVRTTWYGMIIQSSRWSYGKFWTWTVRKYGIFEAKDGGKTKSHRCRVPPWSVSAENRQTARPSLPCKIASIIGAVGFVTAGVGRCILYFLRRVNLRFERFLFWNRWLLWWHHGKDG